MIQGSVKAIVKVLPSSPHDFACDVHMEANFMKLNSRLGKVLREECWTIIVRVAYTCMSKKYNDAANELSIYISAGGPLIIS